MCSQTCPKCKEVKKIYLQGLCFECAMETPVGRAHEANDPGACCERPVYVPDARALPDAETIRQRVSELNAMERAERRELLGVGYVQRRDGCWVLTDGHVKRLRSQHRHLAEQLDEAERGDPDKARHAVASVRVFGELLPGGKP